MPSSACKKQHERWKRSQYGEHHKFIIQLRGQWQPTFFPYTTLFRSLLFSGVSSVTWQALGPGILGYDLYRGTVGGLNLLLPAATYWMTLAPIDRKSTRLNSSHSSISYAVFCL